MRQNVFKTLILFFILILIFNACSAKNEKPLSFIIGVKIYDHSGSYEELASQWLEYNINAVFVSPELDEKPGFKEAMKNADIDRYLIVPTFYNPQALQNDPDLWAITEQGERAKESWVEFVCPSRKNYRKDHIEKIKSMLLNHQPEGLSVDFIRHFVFWEITGPRQTFDSLPNTCFCDTCMIHFENASGRNIPYDHPLDRYRWIRANIWKTWVEWKCGLITEMVSQISEAARLVNPDIKINIHAVPWRMEDYNGAVLSVAGQDFEAMSEFVDYFSPMCYHHMTGRNIEWIESVIQDIYNLTGKPVIPSIQVSQAYLDEPLTPDEFENALSQSLRYPSSGIVLWNWDQLISSPEKMMIAKKYFNKHKTL